MTRTSLPLIAAGLLLASNAYGTPRWLRSSWAGPADSTAVISWTDDIVATGSVEYRVQGDTGEPLTAAARATPTGTAELAVTYAARLEGLAPDTAYEYRVGTAGTWSAWATFRTAPLPGSCQPFRFLATGDSRGQELPLAGYQPSGQWDDILDYMAADGALFAVHTGDFVYSGDDADQWRSEMSRLERLSRKSGFFMVLGNHDDGPGQGAGARYNELFETPANGPDAVDDYFYFVVGNALFVGLSTYSYSMDDQIDWLRTVLEAHRDTVDWRVLFFHTPVWSSGNHGNNEDDRTRAERLVPLLDEFGVELVLNGHDHDYERFHPSRGGFGGVGRVITPLEFDNGTRGIPQGTTYIVTGGGGAFVNPLFTPGEEAAAGSKNLHYLIIDVAGPRMTLTVRDCGGQDLGAATCAGELETVVLEKASVVCGDDEPDAGMPDAGEPDAGIEEDAGEIDAGLEPDAGAAEDAGLFVDAGSVPDAAIADDAAIALPPAAPAAESGCGCGSAGAGSAALAGVFVVLGLALTRRRG